MARNIGPQVLLGSARLVLFSSVVCSPCLFGQARPSTKTAPPQERPAKELSSLEQQRRSIQLMRDSVSAQKATARRMPEMEASSFALPPLQSRPLTPPERLPECEPLPESEVAPLIAAASSTYELRPDLLRAVIRRESAFRPCAVSPKGALGLMQIMPQTADDLNLADPFNPAQNVNAGARYLKDLMKRFGGNLRLALSAYNAGPARVDDDSATDIPETQSYVEQILNEIGGAALSNGSRPGGAQ